MLKINHEGQKAGILNRLKSCELAPLKSSHYKFPRISILLLTWKRLIKKYLKLVQKTSLIANCKELKSI